MKGTRAGEGGNLAAGDKLGRETCDGINDNDNDNGDNNDGDNDYRVHKLNRCKNSNVKNSTGECIVN